MLLRNKFVSIVCLTLLSDFTFALPMNPVIHEGNVVVRYENNLAEIDSGAFAELHWDDFCIGSNETVRFLQPDATAVAINRVLSSNPSSLFGRLESVGQIVLINPNGILVGKDAIIDTGSLIASTFDLFGGTRAKNQIQFPSSMVNEGTIRARSGDLIILGETVVNLGSMFSSKAVLIGAGSDLSLSLEEQPKIAFGSQSRQVEMGIENGGSIVAAGPYAKITLEAPFSTISHKGSLIASNDIGLGGEIRILGGANHIHENSLTDVSGQFGGGTILIGGDYQGQNPSISNSKHTWVSPGSSIFANAVDTGNGGKIIFWGNESTYFRGAAEARGGMMSGDGGFIEISSKGMLDTEGKINLLAPNGKTGMLFLDPSIVTISNAANSGTITAFPPPGYTFTAAMENISNLAATTLQTYLGMGDVTINASSSGPGGPGTGTITLNSDADAPSGMGGIVWAVPTRLTLIADGSITIRNLINNTDTTAAASTVLVDVTAPTVTIGDSGAALANNAAIILGSGRVHVQASTALNLYSNGLTSTGGIRAGLNPADGIIGQGSILVENTGSVEINSLLGLRTLIDASQNIEIHASGNILQSAGAGGDAAIATRGGGDLSVFGGGNITLNGGSGAGLTRAIIIGFLGGNVLTQISGDYILNGGTAAGDGSAGITFQAAAGTLTLSGTNFVMNSGTGVGTNTAQIGATGGGAAGPTAITATGAVTVTGVGAAAGGPKFSLLGSFFGGSSGALTIHTGDLFINGSTTGAAVSGQALVGTNGDITIVATGSVNITGGSAGSNNGAAILAFQAGNHVSVTANSIQIIGGSTTDAFAGIQSLNGPTTIDIGGDCLIQGGSGVNAFAGITSVPVGGTGDLTISGGNFTITGGTNMNARAAIAVGDPGMMAGGNGSLFLTSTGASGITLNGGPSVGVLIAGMGILDSNVTIDTTHLTVNGSSSLGSVNGSAFVTATGDITIGASGNITLNGGAGMSGNHAGIYTSIAGKFINITDANNVIVNGGSTMDSFAYIEAIRGPLTASISGDYILQGGSGASCYAAIGTGDPNHLVAVGTGNVALSGANFSLTGGTGLNANAFIGTGDPLASMMGGDGNVSITSTGASGITLTGGLSTKGTIQTRELPLADISIQTTRLTLNGSNVLASVAGNGSIEAFGDITIDATGDITLTAGSTGNSNEAQIITSGVGKFVHITRADNVHLTGGSTMGSRASILAFAGPFTSTITGDYFLQGGSGDGASAGMAAAPAGGTGDLTISGRNFTLNGGSGIGAIAAMITGQPGGGGGDGSVILTSTGFAGISLTGGSGATSYAMIDTNGTLPTNAIAITSTYPSSNLNLASGSGAQARISTFGGEINLWIAHDINLVSTPGNTATIAINGGASNLIAQAGHSASINSSIVNLGTGDIYFVVDAAFPAPPLFGIGGFHLGSGAFFQTAGGAIRIFTSQQSYNTIDGSFIDAFLVSHSFSAGTLFIDSNQEVWCTYYPSTFGGIPFTIFYKNCLQALAQQANLIAGELLADLHPYNEFPGWWERFTISSAGIDLEHAFATPYFITKRVLGNIWLPKSYTSYLHDDFE